MADQGAFVYLSPSMKGLRAFTLLAGAFLSGFAQADIYRTWNPQTGVVIFTNIKPAEGSYEIFSRDPATPAAQPAVPQAPAGGTTRATGRTAVRFTGHIEAAARATNLEPALLHAVISAESGYNPSARSRAGAVGLMQLMPGTAQRYGVSNRLDPAQSILGGARYLRDLLDMFNDDMQLALAAYNAGEEAVMRYGRRIPPFRETLNYVPRVLRFYRQYRAP